MTERLTIATSDGVTLEARVDSPPRPSRFTVFCHPDPAHGGTMNAPLMIGVARRLVDLGHSVLRFNFRGVGASSGTHDHGVAEQLDISAAVAFAEESSIPISLGGWSFGAAATLNWLADQGSDLADHGSDFAYAGIAPPPERLPDNLPAGPKTIVLGTRDQMINSLALEEYAERMGIDLVKTPGDHFFHGRSGKIGDLIGEALAG